jgi:hypothetical protein
MKRAQLDLFAPRQGVTARVGRRGDVVKGAKAVARAPKWGGQSFSAIVWPSGVAIAPIDFKGRWIGATSFGGVTLPAGLTIHATTAVVSGTPTTPSTGAFACSATNAVGTTIGPAMPWGVT